MHGMGPFRLPDGPRRADGQMYGFEAVLSLKMTLQSLTMTEVVADMLQVVNVFGLFPKQAWHAGSI